MLTVSHPFYSVRYKDHIVVKCKLIHAEAIVVVDLVTFLHRRHIHFLFIIRGHELVKVDNRETFNLLLGFTLHLFIHPAFFHGLLPPLVSFKVNHIQTELFDLAFRRCSGNQWWWTRKAEFSQAHLLARDLICWLLGWIYSQWKLRFYRYLNSKWVQTFLDGLHLSDLLSFLQLAAVLIKLEVNLIDCLFVSLPLDS